MSSNTPSYHGYRFPPVIISHAIWLYHRFCLSFRDVEDLLAERGIIVSYDAKVQVVCSSATVLVGARSLPKISSASDVTCCGQPTIGCYGLAPSLFGTQ